MFVLGEVRRVVAQNSRLPICSPSGDSGSTLLCLSAGNPYSTREQEPPKEYRCPTIDTHGFHTERSRQHRFQNMNVTGRGRTGDCTIGVHFTRFGFSAKSFEPIFHIPRPGHEHTTLSPHTEYGNQIQRCTDRAAGHRGWANWALWITVLPTFLHDVHQQWPKNAVHDSPHQGWCRVVPLRPTKENGYRRYSLGQLRLENLARDTGISKDEPKYLHIAVGTRRL